MSRVVLSTAARLDRREITAYTVRRFGVRSARRLREQFQAALDTLGASPLLGRTNKDLDPPGHTFRYVVVMKRFIGVPHRFKIVHRRSEKRERPLTADTGQDNQTRVKVFGCDKRAEVASVLGNNDQSVSDAPFQHTVVGVATPPEIQRVLSNMLAARVQFAGHLRRQALINKQTHAAS